MAVSGRITTELRTLQMPLPSGLINKCNADNNILSGLDVHYQFHKNKDAILITAKDKKKKFRLNLEYFELYIQRQEYLLCKILTCFYIFD